MTRTGLNIDQVNTLGLTLDELDRDGCASMVSRLRRMAKRAADPEGILTALADDLEVLAHPVPAALAEFL